MLWLKEMDDIGFATCNILVQYDEFKEIEVIQMLKRFLGNIGIYGYLRVLTMRP
ncbi:MAG: hypothetical protein GU359_01205 [Desulfurococcales archaeon]|jgi:hypothetical protein|nr:hypothetical protein [Desulfurococcales archaeon]